MPRRIRAPNGRITLSCTLRLLGHRIPTPLEPRSRRRKEADSKRDAVALLFALSAVVHGPNVRPMFAVEALPRTGAPASSTRKGVRSEEHTSELQSRGLI